MKTHLTKPALWLSPILLTLAACSQGAATTVPADEAVAGISAAADSAPEPVAAVSQLPRMVVHKTPWCGCCGGWVERMQEAGFQVETHDMEDLGPVKERLGVPYAKGSCHTAEIGGYVVEGHVPAEDIKRLLQEKPDAVGLVLPGMPIGSPGMESPDGRQQPFTVELVRRDGTTEPFSSH